MKNQNRAVNVYEAATDDVTWAVDWAVYGAVSRALGWAVYRDVNGAVEVAVYGAVWGAVGDAVYGAADRASNADSPHPALQDFLREAR